MYVYILVLHILAATIWTGGHLVLALGFLPRALKYRSAEIIRQFESRFEAIGIPALVVQAITGPYLAWRLVPSLHGWFDFAHNPLSHLIAAKLTLLVLTLALAINARLRVVPRLSDDNIGTLAVHIVLVTLFGVGFVVIGVMFRTGGF